MQKTLKNLNKIEEYIKKISVLMADINMSSAEINIENVSSYFSVGFKLSGEDRSEEFLYLFDNNHEKEKENIDAEINSDDSAPKSGCSTDSTENESTELLTESESVVNEDNCEVCPGQFEIEGEEAENMPVYDDVYEDIDLSKMEELQEIMSQNDLLEDDECEESYEDSSSADDNISSEEEYIEESADKIEDYQIEEDKGRVENSNQSKGGRVIDFKKEDDFQKSYLKDFLKTL